MAHKWGILSRISMIFRQEWRMLIKILIKRFGIFLFLAGITLLCRRSLVLYLSAAYFGFCFGTVISVMTIQYGPEGLWILQKALLPPLPVICACIHDGHKVGRRTAFRERPAPGDGGTRKGSGSWPCPG